MSDRGQVHLWSATKAYTVYENSSFGTVTYEVLKDRTNGIKGIISEAEFISRFVIKSDLQDRFKEFMKLNYPEELI